MKIKDGPTKWHGGYDPLTSDGPDRDLFKVFAEAISGDGSEDYSLGGLRHLISTNPCAGKVGGIDRREYKWWRNLALTYDSSIPLLEAMKIMVSKLTRGRDTPDLILASSDDFAKIANDLGLHETNKKFTDAGFKNLVWDGITVVEDKNLTISVENYKVCHPPMLFLNTHYIFFRPHEKRDWTTGDFEFSQGIKKPVLVWAGALTMSCASLQGCLSRA